MCDVYALTPKPATPSKLLKLNFYEQPDSAKAILASLIHQDGRATSDYIRSFLSVELLSLEEIDKISAVNDKVRALRQVQIYWAILHKAGFTANEAQLQRIAPSTGNCAKFNPGFNANLRNAAYSLSRQPVPNPPSTLAELQSELEIIALFRRDQPQSPELTSGSGNLLFEPSTAGPLLDFFSPTLGRSGTSVIQPYRMYHDSSAGDFVKNIIIDLDAGKTVILDLGNANPTLLTYFSDLLSRAVFAHQINKFSNNDLKNHFIQIYFEEAHNLFPKAAEPKDTYSRLAKEGAKYHIGIVYSTQSPSTIYGDLLAQTENFFIAHMSSQDEVNALAKMNFAYENLKDDILRAKTPGYMRMLTRSHRFVVPMQALRFQPK